MATPAPNFEMRAGLKALPAQISTSVVTYRLIRDYYWREMAEFRNPKHKKVLPQP